ncbi:MAG: HIT domain-containing protein [Oceanococcus sp.]
MPEFQLAQRLANDCDHVLDWPLCQVLLMRDAHYPWFILVPRRAGLRELSELSIEEDAQYRLESRFLSNYLLQDLQADKLNIAALGNVEPQLHIHHIARYTSDVAWPAPVWGAHPAQQYAANVLTTLLQRSREQLQKL